MQKYFVFFTFCVGTYDLKNTAGTEDLNNGRLFD